MDVHQLTTPALLVDADRLDFNLRVMAHTLPGRRLRPHVKAHKCTALARRQADPPPELPEQVEGAAGRGWNFPGRGHPVGGARGWSPTALTERSRWI